MNQQLMLTLLLLTNDVTRHDVRSTGTDVIHATFDLRETGLQSGHLPVMSQHVTSRSQCAVTCAQLPVCVSYFVYVIDDVMTCDLHDVMLVSVAVDGIETPGAMYYLLTQGNSLGLT